jgi:peptide-methionine (S)-S-oxide reductase
MAIATFAAGCFWGVENTFRQISGVQRTRVGYTGGHTENPTYRDVCSHTTGHAEAVEVTYDSEKVSYDDLLKVFWASHDPTQVNRQGPDVGDSYRTAIFTHDAEQRRTSQSQASHRDRDNSGTRILGGGGVSPAIFREEQWCCMWHWWLDAPKRG